LARKILLADDSVTAQNMGRKILADAGYEVITVNNGSAALKKIAEQKPDVIVLDVYMPGYSGLEVCQRLKEAQETARVPVLLTVGKLEPFKPEEAKRARADGFIVKPFEASELLSALSKLEDKIVPRAEASKPGRFARATAALEEGKYDKTMVIEEDSGWKNRIGFPHRKKEEAAQEQEEESSIYNPMNNDLRTVVEHKPAEKHHEAKAEEARVDLGALAPEGLPKDVTPEEIAALAAAAAQVKGKMADVKLADAHLDAPEHTQPAAEQKSEEKSEEKTAETPAGKLEDKFEEKLEAAAEKSSDQTKAAASVIPSPADVMAAIAGLEPDAATSAGASSGNASWLQNAAERAAEHSADEPVTMALAAAAASTAATSRWTAVAVALAPEESAISLEQEMQKAYAAFAAAETAPAEVVEPVADVHPAVTQPAVAEPVAPVENAPIAEPAPAEPTVTVTAAAEPEPVVAAPVTAPAAGVTETLSAMANAAVDAIGDAVKELEAVAASYVAQKTAALPHPDPAEPALEKTTRVASGAAPTVESQAIESSAVESAMIESSPAVEARVEDTPAAEPAPEAPKLETTQLAVLETKPEEPKFEEAKHEETKHEETKHEETKHEETKHEEAKLEEVKHEEPKREEPIPAASFAAALPGSSVEAAELAPPAPVIPVPSEQISAKQDSEISAAAGILAAGGIEDMAKKESEAAETSAAAWASWRRIRETDPKAASPADSPKEDSSAMAVAAGAEKAPEEASLAADSNPDEIASIVDSVLADMRPKIVEEISRKMGKKK